MAPRKKANTPAVETPTALDDQLPDGLEIMEGDATVVDEVAPVDPQALENLAPHIGGDDARALPPAAPVNDEGLKQCAGSFEYWPANDENFPPEAPHFGRYCKAFIARKAKPMPEADRPVAPPRGRSIVIKR